MKLAMSSELKAGLSKLFAANDYDQSSVYVNIPMGIISSDISDIGPSEGDLRDVRAIVSVLTDNVGEQLERVMLFGSRARGDAGPNSYYNLLIEQSTRSTLDPSHFEDQVLSYLTPEVCTELWETMPRQMRYLRFIFIPKQESYDDYMSTLRPEQVKYYAEGIVIWGEDILNFTAPLEELKQVDMGKLDKFFINIPETIDAELQRLLNLAKIKESSLFLDLEQGAISYDREDFGFVPQSYSW